MQQTTPARIFSQPGLKRLSLACATLLLSGCISYTSHTENDSRHLPDPRLLDQIELGETPGDWLQKHFGEPDAVRRPSDDVRIWQYENLSNSVTSVKAFPLLAIELSDQTRTVYNFEVQNGHIVRFWRDAAEANQTR